MRLTKKRVLDRLQLPNTQSFNLCKLFKSMEKIKVPDKNTFEEKAKAFAESRLGRRLARKYTPKPYEEKRRGLYVMAWIGSFFCNVVAVVTGSTFVFAYVLGLVSRLPEPMLWAALVAGIILVGIEALKQLLVPDLFQDWFQYGWKPGYFLQVAGIVALMGTSTAFNYFGGFDFAGAVSTPPPVEEPELKEPDAVRQDYQPKIDQAAKEAEQYRVAKTWNGKLNEQSGKVYQRLLEHKKSLESQMLAKLDSVEAYNDRATASTKAEYQEKIKAYEAKTQVKGRGLAVFSVVCEFLFLVFCWYRERYEYKTATQYAGFGDEENEETQKNIGQGTTTLPYGQHNNGKHNGITGQATQRRPIGFYRDAARSQQEPPTQPEVIVLTKSYSNTEYQDTFTIEHKGKRYRLSDVERFCRTYRERLEQSEREGNTNTARSRRTQLEYWEERRQELIQKIQQASG